MVTHGHAAARTGAALGRAVELCERLPSSKLRMAAQFAHWSHLMLRGDLSAAVGLADNMLSAASRDGDVQWRLAGLRARGIVKYLLGSFTESIDSLTKFLALWNDGDASVGLGLAHDPGSISVYCYRSYGLHLVGRIADARRDAAAAMEGARLSGHHLIVAQAMFTEACIDYFAEADAAARQRLHQTLEYSTEHNVTYFKMFASGYLSTIEGREGNVDRALCRVSEAIEIARASGTYAYLPGFLAREGEFLTLAGRIDEAYGRFAEAFALEEQTAAHWDKSTNKRLFARTLLADGRAPEAEAQLRQAVSMAEEQGAWLSLLDVACDLAPILAKSGQTVEAIELLTRSMAAFANENTVPILERAHGILQRFVTTNA
jgi:tetratricopeptide (TPR) repeat protein